MSYSNVFVWFCFFVSIVAFVLVRRANHSEEPPTFVGPPAPPEQSTWVPLGDAPDGWGYVAQGLQANSQGALRLGSPTAAAGSGGIVLGSGGMTLDTGSVTFGTGRITFGTGKVPQPLHASSASAIEGDYPPAKMKIEIDVRGEKFILYAANAVEARRFLDRAVSAQHTHTITGKLTWEGK